MSPSIWTQSAGRSRAKRLSGQFPRGGEGQVAARAKLPVPAGFEGVHYLLYTPFRHPPLRNGSRFGTRRERGILYASRELSSAFAEVAYYRLVFLEGTAAPLAPVLVDLTAFSFRI